MKSIILTVVVALFSLANVANADTSSACEKKAVEVMRSDAVASAGFVGGLSASEKILSSIKDEMKKEPNNQALKRLYESVKNYAELYEMGAKRSIAYIPLPDDYLPIPAK